MIPLVAKTSSGEKRHSRYAATAKPAFLATGLTVPIHCSNPPKQPHPAPSGGQANRSAPKHANMTIAAPAEVFCRTPSINIQPMANSAATDRPKNPCGQRLATGMLESQRMASSGANIFEAPATCSRKPTVTAAKGIKARFTGSLGRQPGGSPKRIAAVEHLDGPGAGLLQGRFRR